MKSSAAARIALFAKGGPRTPAVSTTVGFPPGLNLVIYPSGAIVSTKGAAIHTVHASRQAAHNTTTSSG